MNKGGITYEGKTVEELKADIESGLISILKVVSIEESYNKSHFAEHVIFYLIG